MSSKLKERFERLGRVRGVDRVESGSPVVFALTRRHDFERSAVIDATMVLARRGLSLFKAKRTIETLIERCVAPVKLPTVEDKAAVVRELAKLRISATAIRTDPVDVKALREKSRMSQAQFALMHNLSLDTLQKWESGERTPDRAAMNYLREIERNCLFTSLGQLEFATQEEAAQHECAIIPIAAKNRSRA